MILTIALAVYAVGALICARLLAGHLAWKWKSAFVERPAPLDWVAGWCFGLLACWLWLPLLLVRGLGRVRVPVIGAEREAREREQARLLQASRERVAELERELGID